MVVVQQHLVTVDESIQLFFDSLRPCQESQMLARYLHIEPGERILDIGCGTGYLSLNAGWKFPHCGGVVGIDIVPHSIAQAEINLNRLQAIHAVPLPPIRFTVEDAKTLTTSEEPFDVLIANPPFFVTHSSRFSTTQERRIARQDTELTLTELFGCVVRNLRSGGRFYLVIPAQRWEEVRCCAGQCDFKIAEMKCDGTVRKRSGGVRLIRIVR